MLASVGFFFFGTLRPVLTDQIHIVNLDVVKNLLQQWSSSSSYFPNLTCSVFMTKTMLALCFLNVIPLHVNWDTEVDGQLQPWTHAVFVPVLKPWHHILCTGSTRPQLPAWHRQACVNICSNGTGSYSSVVWHETLTLTLTVWHILM